MCVAARRPRVRVARSEFEQVVNRLVSALNTGHDGGAGTRTIDLAGRPQPPWWNDGAADLNRRLIKNTPYAEWWSNRQL